jgi:hypothetical protein
MGRRAEAVKVVYDAETAYKVAAELVLLSE